MWLSMLERDLMKEINRVFEPSTPSRLEDYSEEQLQKAIVEKRIEKERRLGREGQIKAKLSKIINSEVEISLDGGSTSKSAVLDFTLPSGEKGTAILRLSSGKWFD